MQSNLSRRAALKATGISIALPLMESLHCEADGSYVTEPRRMVFVCNTLGLHPASLFPQKDESDYKHTDYLKLLKQHVNDFTLFSGLSHPDQLGKQPHDTEMTWLTAARNPGLAGFKNTVSIDQYAASQLGYATRFPSIVMSSNGPKSQSYTANGVMIPADHRPSKLFAKLFLTGSPQEIQQTKQRLTDGRSILDHMGEQSKQLNRKLAATDRNQLDEYLASIREAEKDIQQAQAWLDRPKPKVDQAPPQDITRPADLVGRTRLLMQLIPLILKTDSSRIVSVVIQDHLSVPQIEGVSLQHHNLSHHGKDPSKLAQLKIIESEVLKQFARLLSDLGQKASDGKRLLDHTSVLFGSNLGNANSHDPTNLPILLAGGGHRHGRYVQHDEESNTPLCNLFVSMLGAMGLHTDRFATSNGSIEI